MVEVFIQGLKAMVDCRRLEGLLIRYQRHREKLKADQDAREAEKKDLQGQLEEALVKGKAEATAGAERVAQAKEQGYQ